MKDNITENSIDGSDECSDFFALNCLLHSVRGLNIVSYEEPIDKKGCIDELCDQVNANVWCILKLPLLQYS